MIRKVPIPERGFDIPEGDFPTLDKIIKDQNWIEFCKQPKAAIIPVVPDFYANASDEGDDQVAVRGKVIPFARRSINEYCSLPTLDGDEYSDYISNELDLQEVVDTIGPSTVWKMSSGESITVVTNNLRQYAKIWHYFIGSQLIPSSHLSDVMKDRAILILCILTSRSIDIGSIMHASIVIAFRGLRSANISRPLSQPCADNVDWFGGLMKRSFS